MSLDQIFPRFVDGPPTKSVALSVFYLLVREFLLVGLLRILGAVAFSADGTIASVGILVLQSILDLVVMFLIYREYLSEALVTLRLEWQSCLKTIAIGTGIAVVLSGIIFLFTDLLIPTGDLFAQFPTFIPAINPLMGVLFLVVLSPVAFCCMFHATYFGGLCGERPWLAYPLVALVLVAIHLLGDREFAMFPLACLSMMPAHLCGCWVYQKTNTIWSSIILVAAVNLLMVMFYTFFPQVGFSVLLRYG